MHNNASRKRHDFANGYALMRANAATMVVTDLDGTLLDSNSRLSSANRQTLESLAAKGCLRVVATGRSLWSALKVLDTTTPIDYLIFASGAGIVSWPGGELLHARHMPHKQALASSETLRELGCDFMLHKTVPDNHHFWYHRCGVPNPDFDRRIERYLDYSQPWPQTALPTEDFSQLLVIQQTNSSNVSQSLLSKTLAPLSVIRTTSPLDHCSSWFEIFPAGVSKASGIEWLVARYGMDSREILVIGNDYNDLDMLEWAQQAQVVANAPEELRRRFKTVPGNDCDGFSVAVRDWQRIVC